MTAYGNGEGVKVTGVLSRVLLGVGFLAGR
jgi:hypothetical protein